MYGAHLRYVPVVFVVLVSGNGIGTFSYSSTVA